MADKTKIEWADATLNYVNGCSLASPGCTNCYAMKQAHRFPVRQGLTVKTKGGMVWTGEVRENPRALDQALAWKRGRAIFWNAHGDLFHEKVSLAWIVKQLATCALTPHHRHMILTKRSDRMRRLMSDPSMADLVWRAADAIACEHNLSEAHPSADYLDGGEASAPWPLPNVWLGVSVEDQQRADERIPDLLATPAAVRFISAEPLLGPIDLESAWHGESALDSECWGECLWCEKGYPPLWNCQQGRQQGGGWVENSKGRDGLDWVIAGGESGPGARPMHPDWARLLRDQCESAAIPFHFKQWGEHAPGEIAGDYLDPDKEAKGLTFFDGRWGEVWSHPEGHADDEPDVYRIGKKRAGRLLDGIEHNGVPA